MRSLKHTHKFKYTKHSQVFDGAGDNQREMGKVLEQLRERQTKGEHIEIRSPKHFDKVHPVKDRHGRTIQQQVYSCFSLTWYTRKDLGLKTA
jgi:hypothetical protein